MKRLFQILATIIVLFLGVALLLPFFIPKEMVREQVETQAEAALGRDVTLEGDVSLSIIPRLQAQIGAITVANEEGFEDEGSFISADGFRASVKLLPLFARKVEVAELIFVEPEINLIRKKNGEMNWVIEGEGETAPTATESSLRHKDALKGVDVALGDVRLIRGHILYDDRYDGVRYDLTKLDMSVELASLSQPFKLSGSGHINEHDFTTSLLLDSVLSFARGEAAPLKVDFKSGIANIAFDGAFTEGSDISFEGKLSLEADDLNALYRFLGMEELPGGEAVGALSVNGRAQGTPDNIVLDMERLTHKSDLADVKASGQVTMTDTIHVDIDYEADMPNVAGLIAALEIEDVPIEGALDRAELSGHAKGPLEDLTLAPLKLMHTSDLLQASFDGSAKMNTKVTFDGPVEINMPDLKALAEMNGSPLPEGDAYRSFAFKGKAEGSDTRISIEEADITFDDIKATGAFLLNLTGDTPYAKGTLKTNFINLNPYIPEATSEKENENGVKGWGDEPIDMSPLKMLNADFNLDVEGLLFQSFEIGATGVDAKLKDGLLEARLKETALYGGSGKAAVYANANHEIPRLGIAADFAGVEASPFLKAASGFGLLQGKGNFQLNIQGAGMTPDELMKSLGGNGDFVFTEGTLSGIDLNGFVADIQNVISTGALPTAFGPTKKTDFDEITSLFSIKDGQVRVAKLGVLSPKVRVDGTGILDIGGQALDLRLSPKAIEGAFEKLDKNGLAGIPLPLRLQGGWGGINMSLDASGIKDLAAAAAKAKAKDTILGGVTDRIGGDAGGLLGDLLGDDASSPDTPSESAPSEEANPTEEDKEEAEEETLEDALKNEARNALSDLFK